MSGDEPADRLAVGIIGTGAFGTRIGRQLGATTRAEVVALADVDRTALAEAAATLGVDPARRYEDYADMLEATALDAVVVATPHTLHYEQITAALDRGLHVLTEKPMVTDLERSRELADRDAAGEEILMVGFQRHLDRAYQLVHDRYHEDDGGPDPRTVTAEITEPWFDAHQGTWRTDPALSDGGVLTDTGRHVVDAVLWTTGLTPVAVRAEMTFAKPEIESRALLQLRFEHDAAASIVVDGQAATVREAYQFSDDDGGARVHGRGWGDREYVRVDADGGEHVPYLDRGTQRSKGHAFVEAVLDGEPLPATPQDALRATAVITAAYEAARSGGWIEVPL